MTSNLLTILGSGFKTSSIATFFFLLIGVIQPVFGQITFDSKEELNKAANSFFDQRDYAKAKPLFSQLLSQDALNANYNYRFGVCILFTEDDAVKPMPYIEGGADSPGVNDEAYYFLGKLYQLNYRFDDAIDAYSKAKSKGVELLNVDIEKEIQACRNGKLLYNPDYNFDPVSEKTAIEKEFFRPYDFRKLKGKVIPMPPQFKTKFDQKNLSGSFVFTPTVGQTLFYASYGEDGSTGKDIYRVRKLPNGEWALPVRLPDVINSELDEDHAFYDAQNEVLYFSSKGHNSMGGSDIFQSAYNQQNDSWSSPLNLQYPFSSPFDDYLYVTDPDLSVAFFTSTRESEEGRVKVFRMALPNEQGDPVSIITGQYLESADSTQTKMKAQLRSNDKLIGEYRTHPVTGKYVIVAEPGQGYELSVAPRYEEAFNFPINLPKHFKFKPLEQEAVFNSTDEPFSLELTNYFNNKGEEDSITTVQSKSSGELPGIVASVKVSESVAAENALAVAAEKGKEEARNEIAAIEQKVREKARQDSIDQAEALAAEEASKATELAELNRKKEQARLDSLAEAEQLAAEVALKAKQAEAERLAKEEAEKARLESIAKEEALAAEKARKEAALAELNRKKEQARLDSLAEAEQLAAEATLKAKQAEAERLAKEEAEKARLESIAKEEALAAEEARKETELAELNRQKEQARLDSLAEAEQLAAEAALKAKQAEAERLAKEEAEKARLERIAREEELAAEEARKVAARLDSISVAAESNSFEVSEEQLLAEEQAKEGNTTSAQEISDAKELLGEESNSITKDELDNAEENADLENNIDESEDRAIAEAMAQEVEGSSLLDSMNAELATLLIELSSDELANPETDPRVIEISEKIFAQEQIEDEKKASRVLANLDERMEQAKALELAKAEEQKRLVTEATNLSNQVEDLSEVVALAEQQKIEDQKAQEATKLREEKELADQQAEKAKRDSIALANELALEALAEKKKRFRQDSLEETQRLAAEIVLVEKNEEEAKLALEKANQLRLDSLAKEEQLAEENMLAKEREIEEDANMAEESVSAADAFLRAIKEAEEKAPTESEKSAEIESAQLADNLSVEHSEETGELVKSGDPFIDEILGNKTVETVVDETVAEVEETVKDQSVNENTSSHSEEKTFDDNHEADSLARELEFELARAEAEALELAVQTEQDSVDAQSQSEELIEEDQKAGQIKESEPVVILEEDVDDAALQAKSVANLQAQLTPKMVEVASEVESSEEAVTEHMIEKEVENEISKAEIQIETALDEEEVKLEEADVVLESKIKTEQETRDLALTAEKAKKDSLAEVERLAVEAEFQIQQNEMEELANRKLEEQKKDSLAKLEELVSVEKTDANNDEVLTEADAFMKAIEELEKAKSPKTPEVADVSVLPDEKMDSTLDLAMESDPVDESKPIISSDDTWLEKHQKLAAEKERALQEKINADRAALGLALKEELAQVEKEIAEIEQKAVKDDGSDAETPVSAVPEVIEDPVELSEPEVTVVSQEPAIEVAKELAEDKEKVQPNIAVAIEEKKETPKVEIQEDVETSEMVTTTEAAIVEEAVSAGVTRLFFITPAMRDYNSRKVDLDFIQDRGKRRLIQRMLAEDRGRLAVLKNIHNSRIDNSDDPASLDRLNTNTRNKDVLSGLELAQARNTAGSEKDSKINWFDRSVRQGITYRLAFTFKPTPVSERILEAMDPLIEANFEIAQTGLSTGYHTKLANARAEFLEYRSRGYSNMVIQAFDKREQIPLTEVMNRAVIEN